MISIPLNRTSLTQYLTGEGIEIGALDNPITIAHQNARIRIADRMSTAELKAAYPGLADRIKTVDYVLKDDKLPVADASQDFIVGNHVIEHIVNPLGALREWHRALKEGGVVFMAYPIPKHCPDAPRRIVTAKHLIEDFESDRRTNADEHILAFAWAWNPTQFPDPAEVERALRHMWAKDLWEMDETAWSFLNKSRAQVERLRAIDGLELHQHAFDLQSFRGGLEYLSKAVGAHFSVDDMYSDRGMVNECILILRKRSAPPQDGVWGQKAVVAECREAYLSSALTPLLPVVSEYNRLQTENQNLQQMNADLLKSTSWRVTAPLRALGTLLGRR